MCTRILCAALVAALAATLGTCHSMSPKVYGRLPAVQEQPVTKTDATDPTLYKETPLQGGKQLFVTLKTRPLVLQSFLLTEPAQPRAAAILFAGGNGKIDFKLEGSVLHMSNYRYNFIVRVRNDLANRGIATAVIDKPSDAYELVALRTTQEHVQDMDAVIRYLRARFHVPVWLVGTSAGTLSAAYVAVHSRAHPDGVVLTSSVTKPNRHWYLPVTDMNLASLHMPVLAMGETGDGCTVTPPSGEQEIVDKASHATDKQVLFISGGRKPYTGPCDALAAHGFYGVEQQAAARIAGFILAHHT